MKKRLFSCLMAVVIAFSMMATPAFAAETTPDEDELNQTLEAVFSFLNDQKTQLHASERFDYEIPVGENVVSVTVENQPEEEISTFASGQGANFDIELNKSYIYTFTINNFYSGSGTIVYKIYYYVWTTGQPNTVPYRLTATSTSINVTVPSGCTLVSSSSSYDPVYYQTNLIVGYGSAQFKTAFLGVTKNFSLQIRLWSFENKTDGTGYISPDYLYDTQ